LDWGGEALIEFLLGIIILLSFLLGLGPVQFKSKYCGQTWATRDTGRDFWPISGLLLLLELEAFGEVWRPMYAMELDKARKGNGPDIIFTIP
jgi:hypothetical protein